MNNTQEFIDAVVNDNSDKTSNAFTAMIMDKVKTTLDIKRVELASSMYNNTNEFVENVQQLDENRMKTLRALKKSVIAHLNDAQTKDYESVKDSPKEQVVFFKKIAVLHPDKNVKADAKEISLIYSSMLGSAA